MNDLLKAAIAARLGSGGLGGGVIAKDGQLSSDGRGHGGPMAKSGVMFGKPKDDGQSGLGGLIGALGSSDPRSLAGILSRGKNVYSGGLMAAPGAGRPRGPMSTMPSPDAISRRLGR